MAVFNRAAADRLVWQPRLHHWHEVNKVRGTLPEQYKGISLLEIYDDLGASPRAYHYFNGTVRCTEGDKVEHIVKEDEKHFYSRYKTPKGSITQVERKTEYGTASLRIEYFLKSPEDFEVLSYVLKHQTYEFNKDLYDRMEKLLGDRSEPLIGIPWGSIQRFFILYMGFQKGVIALWKHRDRVEELLRIFDENDDKRLDAIKKAPFKLVNFGDNIDEGLCSPPLFKRYMLPYYRRRTSELHKAGKFCTSHWDGKIKLVLPFARDTGLDGLECVPPSPMGNVTLEELNKGLEDMVLVDGIPATLFLPYVKDEVLESLVHELLDRFSPRIIVGISDKLPANGDIEKVRIAGEIVSEYRI
jgi:hypothetical protein